jgi:hypothetical protein
MYVYGLLILGGLVQLLRHRRGMGAFRIFARQWRQYGKRQAAAQK